MTSGSRLWIVLILALLCVPLFVGLGRGDLNGDEAIYSFSVDRMLEAGDWLVPKSTPHDDWAFLEKPPLKFWIVALPIHFGLLPHNEFGLRFWDALFGSISLLYVFAIGRRLGGDVAGTVAALSLFAHPPLLFVHGLRSNNMEAALLLAYCGGIYHFLKYVGSGGNDFVGSGFSRTDSTAHILAVTLYFVLGFMTKFVAVLFLPLVLAVATLLIPEYRTKVRKDWLLWGGAKLLAIALCLPWFIYVYHVFGDFVWKTMLEAHVYERFTGSLDPSHLQPWYFYALSIWRVLLSSGVYVIVGIGMAALVYQAIRERKPDAIVLLLWFALPVFLISFGTSKLYHYGYPFLPPLMIAGGYGVALFLQFAPIPVGRALEWWERLGAGSSGFKRVFTPPIVRGLCLATAGIAIVVAVASIAFGPVHLDLPNGLVFKSRGLVRPLIVAVLFGVLGGAQQLTTRAVVLILAFSMLPLPTYREELTTLRADQPFMSTISACLQQVEQGPGGTPPAGLYVDLPVPALQHATNYYFRRVRPWTRAEQSAPERLGSYLTDSPNQKPALVWGPTYRTFLSDSKSGNSPAGEAVPVVKLSDDVVLLLPGRYAACAIAPPRPAGF